MSRRDLYQLYLNMTPDPNQRVAAYGSSSLPALEDSIRRSRPDVWEAYNAPFPRRESPRTMSDFDRHIAGLGAADRQFAANMAQGFLDEASIVPGAVDPLYLQELGRQVDLAPIPPASSRAASGDTIPGPADPRRGSGMNFPRGGGIPRAERERASEWEAVIEALGNMGGDGGGGYTPVTVNRSLFRLSETPEEAALLARELADIEARSTAGRAALTSSWARLSDTNRKAAEKARAQVLQSGDAAAATWTDAAFRAQELAQARAEQAGAFEGRQAINVSPTGGAEDFIMFMESQAPAARQYAERSQETLARDLDWMAGMAGQQGEAYSAELQRQANMMAFQSARDHNRAVQERINAERMALADMEFRASATNAQLAQAAAQSARDSGISANDIYQAQRLAIINDPSGGPGAAAIIATALGIPAAAAAPLARQAAQGQFAAIINSELTP